MCTDVQCLGEYQNSSFSGVVDEDVTGLQNV